MDFLKSLIIQGVIIFAVAAVLSGVHVSGFITALLVALLLSLTNSIIKPIFTIVTIPITVITFGLFLFFINGFMVLFVDVLLSGFYVDNIFWAMIFAFLVSCISSWLNKPNVSFERLR